MRAIVLAMCLVACGGAATPAAQPTTAASTPTATNVDGARAKELVAQGAKLVDVRSPEEYAAGHVDGAVNVPVDTVSTHDFGAKDGAIIVYCGSGARSARAATALTGQGYTAVYDLGAMSNWGR